MTVQALAHSESIGLRSAYHLRASTFNMGETFPFFIGMAVCALNEKQAWRKDSPSDANLKKWAEQHGFFDNCKECLSEVTEDVMYEKTNAYAGLVFDRDRKSRDGKYRIVHEFSPAQAKIIGEWLREHTRLIEPDYVPSDDGNDFTTYAEFDCLNVEDERELDDRASENLAIKLSEAGLLYGHVFSGKSAVSWFTDNETSERDSDKPSIHICSKDSWDRI